jgi:hypothetical protein
MAKTTVTHIVDDLDGSKGASEVSFSLEGIAYTVDLSKKNRAALEKALKPYIDAGTRVTKRRTSGPRSSAPSRKDLSAVREWARGEGIEVSDRGRVPKSVIEKYDAAH